MSKRDEYLAGARADLKNHLSNARALRKSGGAMSDEATALNPTILFLFAEIRVSFLIAAV